MLSDTTPPQGQRRFARLNDPDNVFSRSKYYELAKKFPGLLKKCGGVTLIDRTIEDQAIAASPPVTHRKREVGHV